MREVARADGSAKKKRMARSAAKTVAQVALGVALITVCAWVTIPVFAIPFTLQTFAVAFAGALLGWKKGMAAVAVYLLTGLIGVPVFSGFQAGVSALAGPTGGYLVGFLFLALFSALAKFAKTDKLRIRGAIFFVAMLFGMAVCYAFGTAWFVVMYDCSVGYALMMCVVPYLAADCLKTFFAAVLAVRLERYV